MSNNDYNKEQLIKGFVNQLQGTLIKKSKTKGNERMVQKQNIKEKK